MKRQLENFIKTKVKNPKEIEVKAILDIFEERTYGKGELFKEANTISKELGFLTRGSTRLFMIKENGDDVTGQIVQQDCFLGDMISIRTQESTPIVIEFLENSSMLVASVSKVGQLLETNLAFNILLREHISDQTVAMGKQYITFITGTAKERYQFIMDNNPDLLKKFPLRFIASMIGVTPTQLSRVRNKK